jgi:hypothetical protein
MLFSPLPFVLFRFFFFSVFLSFAILFFFLANNLKCFIDLGEGAVPPDKVEPVYDLPVVKGQEILYSLSANHDKPEGIYSETMAKHAGLPSLNVWLVA